MPQLRTNDGQLFELSEQAARLSATLQNMLDDTAGDAPMPVPLAATSLARVVALLERTVEVIEGAPGSVCGWSAAGDAGERPSTDTKSAIMCAADHSKSGRARCGVWPPNAHRERR